MAARYVNLPGDRRVLRLTRIARVPVVSTDTGNHQIDGITGVQGRILDDFATPESGRD
jgi:hypothetical protein